ncbi:MAG: glycosyltransferase [Phycisphaerae bacterium]|nr:glycosyltransferase [Phycisphaerae bacterium]
MPLITLVTTCYNEAMSVRSWLDDLAHQTRQPDQIVVVDAGSNDGTVEVLSDWVTQSSNRLLEVRDGCTVAQGRNRAIEVACGSVIASTDMGCRLNHDWFEQLVAPLDTSSELFDVVAGNYTVDPSTLRTVWDWADYYLHNKYETHLAPGFLPSSRSIAYRKSVWELLGGYPEDLRYAGDDTVFAKQIYASGLRIALAPEAMAFWRRPGCWGKYLKEAFNYGRGNGEAGLARAFGLRGDGVVHHLPLLLWTASFLVRRSNLVYAARAIGDGHVLAAALLPFLRAACVYKTGRGLWDGVSYGASNCVACRARLRRESRNSERAFHT